MLNLTNPNNIIFNLPASQPDPVPPSPFELGVAGELRALAETLESSALHIKHFSITITDDGQKLEIEVA